jgi:alpha-mannosidase
MKTLHVVTHTHWDREWYRTFQDFRFRLVRLVDRLLDLLEGDPQFRHFTLDGQTTVLDDYLAIRPEQEPRLRRLIESGRLLVGPWYVLPDEFLEGPEPMIRNLLMGQQGCRRFTSERQPMEAIAYLPDSFGHISQIPQIAAGFGMAAACLWRGVGPAPTEFRWAAPDGTEVLMLHLRESYSNGAWLANDVEGFAHDVGKARDALAPHAPTEHLLIMNGTDHMEPSANLHACLRETEARLGDRVLHSTLPEYLASVQHSLGPEGLAALPLRAGEMRSPERAHLLPAILSTRIWIKQANCHCENLLTRWAEPAAALAEQVCGVTPHRGFLAESWRWLLQNHPHDSICGCSIDQVHDEMQTRFAWSEQIAEEVTRASLAALAERVDPGMPGTAPKDALRVVVFNPTARARTDRVRVHLPYSPSGDWLISDDAGRQAPHRVIGQDTREIYNERMARDELLALLTQMAGSQGDQVKRLAFTRADTEVREGVGFLDLTLLLDTPTGQPSVGWDELAHRIGALLADETLSTFHLRVVEEAGLEVELLARGVPPVGYRQFHIRAAASSPPSLHDQLPDTPAPARIENEFFSVEADPSDGTLALADKRTGRTFTGLNRFVDGGDRGDEYNFCAPQHDRLVDAPSAPPVVRCVEDGIGQAIEIDLVYAIPTSLAEGDRSSRSAQVVGLPITTRVALSPGVCRIDIETAVTNAASDHRLRALFPLPFSCDRSWAEGHFDVLERQAALPSDTGGWSEQPVGTHPQLTFVDLTDGQEGLLLANQGLPEYELLQSDGSAGTPGLALTLLRCVGWLSRGDLTNRVGPAGPALATPGAQCLGRHTFHYALVPHTGNYLTVQHEAHAFIAPLRAVPLAGGGRCDTAGEDTSLPPAGSFLHVSPAAVILTAVKPPQQGEGMIVRVYNSARTPVRARLTLWRPFGEITRVHLDEGDTVETLARDAAEALFPLRPKEIATIHLKPPLAAGAA